MTRLNPFFSAHNKKKRNEFINEFLGVVNDFLHRARMHIIHTKRGSFFLSSFFINHHYYKKWLEFDRIRSTNEDRILPGQSGRIVRFNQTLSIRPSNTNGNIRIIGTSFGSIYTKWFTDDNALKVFKKSGFFLPPDPKTAKFFTLSIPFPCHWRTQLRILHRPAGMSFAHKSLRSIQWTAIEQQNIHQNLSTSLEQNFFLEISCTVESIVFIDLNEIGMASCSFSVDNTPLCICSSEMSEVFQVILHVICRLLVPCLNFLFCVWTPSL